MTQAFEDYQQLRVLKQPLTGVYLSFFLMLTLMILVGATWMGLYLAKRITRPVQMLAAAAREIGAGHLDHRVEPETRRRVRLADRGVQPHGGRPVDSRRRLERSTIELERKTSDVEARRRYIETILERIATGVISVDTGRSRAHGQRGAPRLLGLDSSVSAARRSGVRHARAAPLASSWRTRRRSREEARRRKCRLRATGASFTGCRDDALVAKTESRRHRPRVRRRDAAHPGAEGRGLAGGGAPAGARDQESADADSAVAERLRRHFSSAAAPTQALVEDARARSSARWNR